MTGLDRVPRDEWPNVLLVHLAFQLMVGLGTVMMAITAWAAWLAWRRQELSEHRAFLRVVALATPTGFLAVEAGWMVTELGRQPWIIHGVMRTADAVTPMPGLVVPFTFFTAALLPADRGGRVADVSPDREEPDGRGLAADLHAGAARCLSSRRRCSSPWALVAALAAYLVMAGADFGGGVWDLFATGPRRRRQRALIAESIGPIWEANHVWLILAVVLLFVCFPPAFARLSVTLHIPLTLMLVGIVLRGSAFTFRTYDSQSDDVQRRWGLLFSWASLVTPVLLGVAAGTIAAGDIPAAAIGHLRRGLRPPVAPPLSAGNRRAWPSSLCAYLAAVYLTMETDDPELQDDFRLRAFGAGIGVFVAAMLALFLARRHVPLVWQGLTASTWAPGYQVVVGGMALLTFTALWQRRYRIARVAAPIQAVLILGGWALCQYPYLLPPDLTIAAAAAPKVTLELVLAALALGFVVLVPSLIYLFRIFKSRPQRV